VYPDFKELLLAFNAHNVEYLIVGAHALAAHGHVRATKDLDLWVRPETSNAQRVLQALSEFGAPVNDLTIDDLSRKKTIFQVGLPPLRIDIITDIDGVEFADAWPDAIATLREIGFTVIALTPDSCAQQLSALPSPASRIALLVGAEGDGLTQDALDAADVRARIPMTSTVDSLNVTTAASIAMYHLFAGQAESS